MSAYRYYRVANPADSTPLPGTAGYSRSALDVPEAKFAAAVAGQPPDVVADSDSRTLVMESRGFPPGSVVYWRVDDETGKAEGWLVSTPTGG